MAVHGVQEGDVLLRPEPSAGVSTLNRTIWIAGLCLVIICCLLATKMVLAAVSPGGDMSGETTASLSHASIPGVDTLSDSDRGVDMSLVDLDESARLPLVSKAVRANGRNTAIGLRHPRPTDRTKAVLRPARRNGEPVKSAAVSCRQLDPIARFLASAKIGPRCQA